MDEKNVIALLQWAQLQHDAKYHQDIHHLSTQQKFKHFTLHLAKYAGKFAELRENDHEQFQKTLVDTCIISIALANAFNVNIARRLNIEHAQSLTDVSKSIANTQNSEEARPFPLQLTILVGKLAKNCESLDHLENFPFREQAESVSLEVFIATIHEASRKGLDLHEAITKRLTEVEKKYIFHNFLK
ncbi:hypothetical protein KBC55_02580 [Patescibacteria group bacterium]|nr:hypothetical protein [Patescibacteria group bacterium]